MAKARKEIDKESMYQKIMPSSMRSASEEAEPPVAEKKKKPASSAARPRKTTKPVSISSRPAAAAPVTRLLEETEASAPPPFTPLSSAPNSSTTAPAPATPAPVKSSIVNIMELLIDRKIELAMEKFNCCTCDKCRQDIWAFALNKLSPRYIVQDDKLVTEALEDKEANTQVTTALVQAILRIKANPKHN